MSWSAGSNDDMHARAVVSPLGLNPTIVLDPGIALYVEALREAGVHTFESCEGGPGHAFPQPTVRFAGERAEGFRALAVALERGFPVRAIRRYWAVIDGEPSGPDWEIVFREPAC